MPGRILSAALLVAYLAFASAQCEDSDKFCCAPGRPQHLEDEFVERGSFCTDKPFEPAYTMNRGNMVPISLNFIDYCSDEVIFTSYFSVQVDKFSVVAVPCTFEPPDCNLRPQEQQQACFAGKKIWTDPAGSNRCSDPSFFQRELKGRVCNSANHGRAGSGRFTYPKSLDYIWTPPVISEAKDGHNGYCSCNVTTMRSKNMTIEAESGGKGVPNGFIKAGMSTFYVQMVVGGRKTSDFDPGCSCGNMTDISDSCMCALGRKKIPYMYNNSFIPYFTTLISMQKGGLLYENTGLRYDFDANGAGCVACPIDNCWGRPKKGLDSWLAVGRFLVGGLQENKICAIPGTIDSTNAAAPYCDYPKSDQEIAQCSLKVYVAWQGTDGFGRSCQSSNMMFSKFSQMGVSSMAWSFYTATSNLATDVTRRITRRLLGEEMAESVTDVADGMTRRFSQSFIGQPTKVQEVDWDATKTAILAAAGERDRESLGGG